MSEKHVKDALESIARRGVPENTNLWPALAAHLERKSPMTTLRSRPMLAVLIALFVLLALSGVAYALGRAFGYIPGVGLVENTGDMRVLAGPASATRDGVTLTITQALVYPDHIQLVYEVSGLAPENNGFYAEDGQSDPKAFCGGVAVGDTPNKEGDPVLLLPDGTRVERMDGYDDRYPENSYAAMPVYLTSLPADVTELTVTFQCIYNARHGAAPENWEIPVSLEYVPAGTAFGESVIDVAATETSSASDQGIKATLSKVVVQDGVYSFFVQTAYEDSSKPVVQLMPQMAYLIDSTGQKIGLNPWVTLPSILEQQDPSEPWEMKTTAQPGYGPYTLEIDNIAGQDGHWELHWTSPDQTGVDLLNAADAVSSQPGASGITAELTRVVKLDAGYLFYLHMALPEQNPDLRVVSPLHVYVIDSTGRKVELTLDGPQAYLAGADNVWQFSTKEQLASGPLKVAIENAEARYSAFDGDTVPSPETVAAHSFTFDAGADPQPGQTWSLDAAFEIGGYQGKVTSVQAVTVDSQELSFPELRSDTSINSGYEFTIQSLDPSLNWKVMLSLARPEGSQDFVDCIGYLPDAAENMTTHTVACRGLPASVLQVTIDEVSILVTDTWEIDWSLPAQ